LHGNGGASGATSSFPQARCCVIDSTTNFVEHPQLVADRILRYAEAVGKERVIAGVDCGFGTFANVVNVDPRIVWAKLRSLSEGADLATAALK
jgi:5-methyltetrahydropteroyltriglutamate--homocysteine methyltransferase